MGDFLMPNEEQFNVLYIASWIMAKVTCGGLDVYYQSTYNMALGRVGAELLQLHEATPEW